MTVRRRIRGCDLQGAHLLRAVLFGTRLDDADLRKADLRETDLSHASLVGARLAGANLRKARLFSTDLRQTSSNKPISTKRRRTPTPVGRKASIQFNMV